MRSVQFNHLILSIITALSLFLCGCSGGGGSGSAEDIVNQVAGDDGTSTDGGGEATDTGGDGGSGGGGGGGTGTSTTPGAPVASFTITPSSGSAPFTVQFDASASSDKDGDIAGYTWTFGDDSTGTGMIVSHTYENRGEYTVQLTVTDDTDLSTVASSSVTVYAVPVAVFTATPDKGAPPLSVSLDASGSTDGDNDISAYAWDFGDGSAAGTGQTTVHTYDTDGQYTITLTVTDAQGYSSQAQTLITVNSGPTADIQVSTQSGPFPLTVDFDGSGSSDPDGSITSYEWTFADGNSDVGQSASNIYYEAGVYNASLKVTDEAGLTNTAVVTITVDDVEQTFSVSGVVTASYNSVIDYDVNDLNSDKTARNNSFAQAQPILTPVMVGGYMNRPYEGRAGSYTEGDIVDFYKATLAKDQIIYLTIGDKSVADFDLYLYDSAETLVDSSVRGVGSSEDVTVPANGEYYIKLTCETKVSNYVLSVGRMNIASMESSMRLSDDFVPGQAVVKYKKNMKKDAGKGLYAQSTVLSKSGDLALVQLPVSSMSRMQSLSADSKANKTINSKLNTLLAIKELQKDPNVEYAEPNGILQTAFTPNDSYYELQWHYPLINLPQAWDITVGSSEVIVGVIDTGVLLSHSDFLGGQLVDGYDFISNPAMALDGDGIDSDPDDPGDQMMGGGASSFHGTHVSGTIAAATDNSNGGAGIAGGCRIMPLRALGFGGGTEYDICQAMLFAAGLTNDSGTVPDETADIVNMSLGGPGYRQFFQDTVTAVREAGVIVIAAAGNDNTSTPSYPAAYDGVVSVSAVGLDKKLAPYSNYGTTIDIAAPGGDMSVDRDGDGYLDGVLSTMGEEMPNSAIEFTYDFAQGTSMACPHVAGVAALMESVDPTLSPEKFDVMLQAGYLTEDLGESQKYGYGLIDALKAVQAVQDNPGELPPVLVANPSGVSMGSLISEGLLLLKNEGQGDLEVLSVTPSEAWITCSADVVDTNGLGTYTVTVDRSALADGAHTGTIEVDSDANDLSISVYVLVSDVTHEPDAGFHYVLLIDALTDSVVAQDDVAADAGGQYSYEFIDVEAGSYYIVGGSDMDNDETVGDAGEAIGAYSTLDDPVVLYVVEDFTDLDFETSFSTSVGLNALSEDKKQKEFRLSKFKDFIIRKEKEE